tara:strand:- start:577 stop:990 length:414 start_codon:yes stop_codon:yes gene_type:complete
MSNPPYFDVMTLLQAEAALALTVGGNLFGGEWGGVDAQVLCLNAPALPSELPELVESVAVQILVRGERAGAATGSRDFDVYQRAKAITDVLLLQLDTVQINGVPYKGFEEGSGLAPLGKDKNERFTYSMNFITWRNR